MNAISIDDLLQRIDGRKAALGICNTPEKTEALGNKGTRRTSEKREMLARSKQRARAAGVQPLKVYH